ncbi:MAG: 3-hydroxybenzoate 4-monooxygenase [Subtercola sp.]|nr:3-hydroxybenzoate 4-monooxygenase [Subtercola sp.]
MQFHHHGYVSTDPRIQSPAGAGLDRPEELPEEVDVLIVGTGPAGMITAAQLAQFPNITTRIVERREGRLAIGQADGIQARSVETFQAFGFADRIIAEAYRITEMAFWKPNPLDPSQIVRAARAIDDPAGISEFPHLIVNQARVLDYFAEFMARGPARLRPDYGIEFRSLVNTDHGEYPVEVTLAHTAGEHAGEPFVVRAKYVVGADGARSAVRDAIGCTLAGDQAYHAWGVMDVLAVTDFPDIRTKCAIQSGSGGNILHIPREGGHLFRMYVDLGEVASNAPHRHGLPIVPAVENRRRGPNGAVRTTTIEQIIEKANEILHPYTLDVKNVAWHSVYEVAHRLTDRFDDVLPHELGIRTPRIFITGDACHTHSAKAGQGMNVSMQDGFNLGWKLAHVLEGRSPEALLATYSAERQPVAKNLIDFDKKWSALMATRPEDLADPTELEDFYTSTAEFPAGFMTQYPPSLLIGSPEHQALATGYPLGKRFRSAPVIRVADANPLELGHQHLADGRWRIYAFADAAAAGVVDAAASGVAGVGAGAGAGAGSASGAASPLTDWAEWLATSPDSPVVSFSPAGPENGGIFDVKVIYQQTHDNVDITRVPEAFRPRTGPFDLIDYEKAFAADPTSDIFDLRGIDRGGVVVVVRPDQYVAAVLPLTATAELAEFFGPIFTLGVLASATTSTSSTAAATPSRATPAGTS